MSGTRAVLAFGAERRCASRRPISTTPSRLATTQTPESRATLPSRPVPTSGAQRADERHGLTLHVRAHERAVRVVVLEERNERRSDRHQLVRRHVHQLDHVGRDHQKSPLKRARDEVSRSLPFSSSVGVRLRDVVASLLRARCTSCTSSVTLPLVDLAVRRLDEAVLVDAREGRERRDEADVRTFRRLDRADAAVVRGVNVADFEARALARQTAGPERRETTLVRDFGERVRLVHELRELRADRSTPSPPRRPASR